MAASDDISGLVSRVVDDTAEGAAETVASVSSATALDAIGKAESKGKNRKSVLKAVEQRIKAVSFSFDGKNLTAQKVADRQAALMVTKLSEETIQALRALVVRSIREGIPPYEAARMIRGIIRPEGASGMIGLTTQQAMAAMNYREALINSGLTLEKVNTKVDRYVAKKIRERAITISRTECLTALNRGQQEAWKQAQREGILSKKARQEWITTPFDACKICMDLDGETAPINGDFDSMIGPLPGPTAHPNCRCALGVSLE